jgi:hypothetical protein
MTPDDRSSSMKLLSTYYATLRSERWPSVGVVDDELAL